MGWRRAAEARRDARSRSFEHLLRPENIMHHAPWPSHYFAVRSQGRRDRTAGYAMTRRWECSGGHGLLRRVAASGGRRVTATEPAEVLVWEMHATIAA
jgi:hypothetical protein